MEMNQTDANLKKMCATNLCIYFNVTAETLLLYKRLGRDQEFPWVKELYLKVHAELTERLKHEPLEFLTKLAEETNDIPKDEDPDNRTETSDNLNDIAKREIHRRSVCNMTYNPTKKLSGNPENFGFPRKPKK